MGFDGSGREILSYLHGTCEISDTAWQSQGILLSAATILREMHDISTQYPQTDFDRWAYSFPDEAKHEVICHNDFGLYNLVVNDGHCSGVIDFDLAGPGPRLHDIAYAAYWLVPLSMNADDMKSYSLADIKNGNARLKLFCKTYGVEADASLLDMLSEILHHLSNESAMINAHGRDTTATLKADGHLDHWMMEALAFDQNRALFDNIS